MDLSWISGSLNESDAENAWQTLRGICRRSLASRHAFVLILHDGAPLADASVLAPSEMDRNLRFRLFADRQNHILGRTAIDRLLRPADCSSALKVVIDHSGRPSVRRCPPFSISHSGRYFAFAISPGGLVGVDVETFEGVDDTDQLLSLVAHPEEVRVLASETSGARARLQFRRLWTRKEAALKAMGTGWLSEVRRLDTRLQEFMPRLAEAGDVRVIDIFGRDEEAGAAVALSDTEASGLDVCSLDWQLRRLASASVELFNDEVAGPGADATFA